MRELSHRLTQHKRRGGRSLSIPWGREEAPTLYLKGSKPGAVPAGWSLVSSQTSDDPRATRVPPPSIIGRMADECSVNRFIDRQGSTRGVDRVIADLAQRQHGVVGRGQLAKLGIGTNAIEGRVRRGQLHSVHRGIYAVGHRLLGIEGRWLAAVLACGRGAALSRRSAAQLWRLLPRSPGRAEVTRTQGWRAPSGIVAHRSSLPADELAAVSGIPVTSVSRTLLDLASVLSRRQLERALNEAEVLGLTDSLSLPDLLQRYPRCRGSAALRVLLRDDSASSGITRSELEERFVALVDANDLPRPRLNATLSVGGRFVEVDCLWADRRLVVELDGRASHGTVRAFEEDRERDRLLLGEGWRVIRLTWRQVRDDAPTIAVDLRKQLRSAPRPPTLKG